MVTNTVKLCRHFRSRASYDSRNRHSVCPTIEKAPITSKRLYTDGNCIWETNNKPLSLYRLMTSIQSRQPSSGRIPNSATIDDMKVLIAFEWCMQDKERILVSHFDIILTQILCSSRDRCGDPIAGRIPGSRGTLLKNSWIFSSIARLNVL